MRLGHYLLKETIGVGTFGKVKGTFWLSHGLDRTVRGELPNPPHLFVFAVLISISG